MITVARDPSDGSGIGFLAFLRPVSSRYLGPVGRDSDLFEYSFRLRADSIAHQAIEIAAADPRKPMVGIAQEGGRRVTVAQASDYTGLAPTTLREWLRRGEISGTKHLGRWLVDWESLLQALG